MTNVVKNTKVSANDLLAIEARYERACKLMQGIWTNNLAFNTTLFPVWIGDSDCFWYERDTREEKENSVIYGKQYRLVNAKAAKNYVAFDHELFATALSEVSNQQVDARKLPIAEVEMEVNQSETSDDSVVSFVRFLAFNKRWSFSAATGICQELEPLVADDGVVSPDGDYAVFARGHNLWLRNLKTKEEKALTSDGEEDYVYGAVGSAWGVPMGTDLQVLWSPDSKRIFTVQRDTRRVKPFPVVHHVPQDGTVRPTVQYFKVSHPGEDHIEELRLLAIEVETGKHQPASYCKVPVTRNSWGFFDSKLGWWGKDNRHAYFLHVAQNYKFVRVLEFDTATGSTRLLFEETSNTHINLMHNSDESPTLLPLAETNELIWFSERTGWAHLYLYDLESGNLKRTLTLGNWLVRNIVYFDSVRREIFAQTAGRVPDRDPYYRDLVRIQIDTGEIVTIASGDHEYVAITQTQKDMMVGLAASSGKDVRLSRSVPESGNYAVLTRSRANEAPVSILVDRDGEEVMKLETADVSALPDGWQWPEPVKLEGADGKTDIYGLVYRPSDFSPDKSYPVVSHVFNSPELPWVPKGSFTNDKMYGMSYLDAAAVAELGFIVVQIDGRGTPFRDKTFFDHGYGWAESASDLEDHTAGIHQLAERYPYMDLDRVGCYAPTGGPGPVQGLLRHPEFYKVGIAPSLHDGRLIPSTMWSDKFEGSSGSGHLYPEHDVKRLQGKLLLMIGMLDWCTPPAGAFRVVEALQKANKDFDLIALPNLGHDHSPYLTRRAWDYLVRHLMGVEPPKEFNLAGVFGAE